MGAEIKERIWEAYEALTKLLWDLRVDTSREKLVPPTTRLEFLGITFDSHSMTMEISEQKMMEIRAEIDTWLYKTQARRKEVESLIGKLQFMAKCIRSGRIFISRLIQWIRGMDRKQEYHIPREARKDIAWWGRCVHQFTSLGCTGEACSMLQPAIPNMYYRTFSVHLCLFCFSFMNFPQCLHFMGKSSGE